MRPRLRVVKFPKQKRKLRPKALVDSAVGIADQMPDLEGYALVAWKTTDGYTEARVGYCAGRVPTYLVSTMAKEILDDFI